MLALRSRTPMVRLTAISFAENAVSMHFNERSLVSPFEWLVLGLLALLAVLVIVAIFVGLSAANNAREAKNEAEQERLLVRGTGVTPAQIQEAVELVLHETGVLGLVGTTNQLAITAGGEEHYSGDGRQMVPVNHVGPYGEQYPHDRPPPDGYREVRYHDPQRPPYDNHPTNGGNNGRLPVLVGTYRPGSPFGAEAGQARRDHRDPLGTHLITDTLTSLPPVREDDLSDPDADVEALERRFKDDAETTQGWSLAWNGGSGEHATAADPDENP